MSVSGILETTARLVRRRARVLIPLAAIFLTPGLVAVAVAGNILFEAITPLIPQVPGQPIGPSALQLDIVIRALALLIAASLFASLAGALLAIAVSRAVDQDYRGSRPGFQDSARHVVRRVPVALVTMVFSLGTMLLTAVGGAVIAVIVASSLGRGPGGGGLGAFLALVVGVATGLGILILAVRWSLALPVVALEPVGARHALVRSWRLTQGAAWRTFGVIFLVSLVVAVLGSVITETLGLALGDLPFGAPSAGAFTVRTIVGAAVAVVSAPVAPVAVTILYFDQRVRREGHDLSMPLQ